METAAIRPSRIDVVGVHPRWSRLIVLQIHLDARPSQRWRELFVLAGASLPAGPIHDPAIAADIVTLTPPDDAMEAEVAHVEARIRLANARYAAELRASPKPVEVTPEPTVAETTPLPVAPDDPRLRAARRKALNLSDAFTSAHFEVRENDEIDF